MSGIRYKPRGRGLGETNGKETSAQGGGGGVGAF